MSKLQRLHNKPMRNVKPDHARWFPGHRRGRVLYYYRNLIFVVLVMLLPLILWAVLGGK